MFCPQCGTESSPELKFCRTCGANLRVIGKAVTLSEAIARSDSVPAKVKDLVKSLKIEKVTDEVSRAMEKMKLEIAATAEDHRDWVRARTREQYREHVRGRRKEKTPEERRERYLTRGFVTMFSGVGLSIFLYFLTHALTLKLPADLVARVPFEIDPVIRAVWTVGLIPTLAGFGRIIAGLTIRRDRPSQIKTSDARPLRIGEPEEFPITQPQAFAERRDDDVTAFARQPAPDTVTDRTTNILEHQLQVRQTDEIR